MAEFQYPRMPCQTCQGKGFVWKAAYLTQQVVPHTCCECLGAGTRSCLYYECSRNPFDPVRREASLRISVARWQAFRQAGGG